MRIRMSCCIKQDAKKRSHAWDSAFLFEKCRGLSDGYLDGAVCGGNDVDALCDRYLDVAVTAAGGYCHA